MARFQIESKAGVVYGVYEGDTSEQAFAAMCADAGDETGSEAAGSAADWIIRPVETYSVVEDPDGGCQQIGEFSVANAPTEFLRNLIASAIESGTAEATDSSGCLVRAYRQ
jgi:hypothetical protein